LGNEGTDPCIFYSLYDGERAPATVGWEAGWTLRKRRNVFYRESNC
jgi:hypothetical protein